MQERHNDRERYFNELAATAEKYYLPYIAEACQLRSDLQVLEIGCGDGGNLLPFARLGCKVLGVDLAACRIDDARRFFENNGAEGEFIAADIFTLTHLEARFDLIICHDVLEHIGEKQEFLHRLRRYLAPGGTVFMSFPAWQMPFGGHQQICHNRFLSHLPFFHLLPRPLYRGVLRAFGEPPACISELLSIKSTATTIELFERVARRAGFKIFNRRFYFINPHYEAKFGLRPRRLTAAISGLPVVRNFFTTSCFYLLK